MVKVTFKSDKRNFYSKDELKPGDFVTIGEVGPYSYIYYVTYALGYYDDNSNKNYLLVNLRDKTVSTLASRRDDKCFVKCDVEITVNLL